MTEDSGLQRVARLTPLSDVLASFDLSIRPVAPREETLAKAAGLTLAADVIAASSHPKVALALRDGYAVASEQTLDASNYAPVTLPGTPVRVDLGEPLPQGADAVAALDFVQVHGARVEVLSPVAPGDGVIAPGIDANPQQKLKLAGAALRRIDVALLSVLGIERVMVREPRVRVLCVNDGAIARGAAGLIASAIDAESGTAVTGQEIPDETLEATLEAALNDPSVDAAVVIGGTGSGKNDRSVQTLSRLGRVAFHGIGIAPGETTALGFVNERPVLLLPGRMDGAIAGWLTVGRRLLARLAFRLIEDQPFAAELARKISSPLGVAEVILVRRRLGRVEPVASGYWPLQALARAEGWVLVPADSEGFPEGTRVVVRPLP